MVLLPIEAPGFVQDGAPSSLLAEGVTIHTANAPGIVPRSYAPPGYEHTQDGNYNDAIGYLENGNKR